MSESTTLVDPLDPNGACAGQMLAHKALAYRGVRMVDMVYEKGVHDYVGRDDCVLSRAVSMQKLGELASSERAHGLGPTRLGIWN